ncbi:heat shock 70 kDa protein 12A-like isoform X2 [Dreissena polymorpha]|nr:heat shock 70 kDa protein 12A-like isoform X2 [Dreissena polymorpha]
MHDFQRDPCKVSAKTWSGNQLTSLKGPTCVLIKPDGKTLERFGFDAETRYSQLSQTGEHKKWYYFKKFKMKLWNKPIHKDTMLDDESGKSLPALTVFSLSIRYMIDDLSSMSNQQVSGLNLEDIYWVLTVPAIWDDSAKQFMRLAAQEAGIPCEQLLIALEPEAASIYCRHAQVQVDATAGGISSFKSGSKYLVLDAGGGTIDITVHEVCFGGKLKELFKATGGAWGGTMVDKAFLDFLADLIGKDVLQRFKDDHMEDFLDLLRDFEIKKRATNSSSEGLVTIKLPLVLIELVDECKGLSMTKIVQSSRYANKVTLASDKFRLDFNIFRSFFTESINAIVHHMKTLLREGEPSKAGAILMVGGYSESPLLAETMREKFPRLEIIVPTDAGLAVLKGAVIFGHLPTSITERVSKYTYGVSSCVSFDKDKHPIEKLIKTGLGDACEDIFSILVSSDQKLIVGEK